ncbi:GreA/GreB family elongation factor [Rhodopirellula maiorica SM1]|uniref:GreA/GreB family elongation factor n=1 Tax=Rhodopirellula maiorica SM1 TaxID=1265738 RepID=M5RP36_9BACT|nr:nucleoside diphosphate kinase regulator [Rhodopirellula maiorica]EMI20966.1 GreA/GreB family elongation factor [Rhodopirellula maiorica SM1]
MSYKQIVITRSDYQRLDELLSTHFTQAIYDRENLLALRGKLNVAEIVDSREIPADVVSMDSIIQLRNRNTDKLETYTLVYPEEAHIATGKLSVLSPIGTAILGCRVGDCVHWNIPSGSIKMQIDDILFHPERKAMAT